jgi:hypothetical protein
MFPKSQRHYGGLFFAYWPMPRQFYPKYPTQLGEPQGSLGPIGRALPKAMKNQPGFILWPI